MRGSRIFFPRLPSKGSGLVQTIYVGLLLGVAFWGVGHTWAAPAEADGSSPRERILISFRAMLYDGPGDTAKAIPWPADAGMVLYAGSRQGNRLAVGVAHDRRDGWVDAAATLPWALAITAVPSPPAGRNPLLFFKDHDAMAAICQQDDLAPLLEGFYAAARTAPIPAGSPLAAIESSTEERRDVLAIIAADDQFRDTRLLNVAFVAARGNAPTPLAPNASLQSAPLPEKASFATRPGGQARPPAISTAWVAENDLLSLARGEPPAPPALQLALLLTRRQFDLFTTRLNALWAEAATSQHLESKTFIRRLQTIETLLLFDPDELKDNDYEKSAQYERAVAAVAGIPYKPGTLSLTESDWQNKSINEKAAFFKRFQKKLAYSAAYGKDAANWQSYGATDPDARICQLPLEALP